MPVTRVRCRAPRLMLAALATRAGVLTISRTSNRLGSTSAASDFLPIGYTELDCLRDSPLGMATISTSCSPSFSESRSESMSRRGEKGDSYYGKHHREGKGLNYTGARRSACLWCRNMHEWRQYVGPGRLAFSIHGVSKCIGPSWKKAAEAVVH
jgi:hypothetical protein